MPMLQRNKNWCKWFLPVNSTSRSRCKIAISLERVDWMKSGCTTERLTFTSWTFSSFAKLMSNAPSRTNDLWDRTIWNHHLTWIINNLLRLLRFALTISSQHNVPMWEHVSNLLVSHLFNRENRGQIKIVCVKTCILLKRKWDNQ